jgi:hypothetical protein
LKEGVIEGSTLEEEVIGGRGYWRKGFLEEEVIEGRSKELLEEKLWEEGIT